MAYLIDVVVARKVRFAEDQLGEYATDRPNVDGIGILMTRQHNLGRAVPPRNDIFSQEQSSISFLVVWLGDSSRKAKVADLEVAIRIHQ